MTTLLDVHGLRVEARTPNGQQILVDDFDLKLYRGEIIGLIGESGCGKTTAVRSVIGLLERNVQITDGVINVVGQPVFQDGRGRFRGVRGRHVGMVFQAASTSMNPLLRIHKQLDDVLRRHRPSMTKPERRHRMLETLGQMGFADPDVVLSAFPHQLSGGMRQRAAIALAVVTGPEIIIADECTSSLDVTTQAEVIQLLRRLVAGGDCGMVFVTHDLLLASDLCTHIAVMYSGQLVERGPVNRILRTPTHPYTRALLAAVPKLNESGRLQGIKGSPPLVYSGAVGCRFATRCSHVQQRCIDSDIDWYTLDAETGARCVLAEDSTTPARDANRAVH